ncbi:L-aspartate oxidase [Sulfuriflexus sp.]|uniref:L-aspartate oxidase n=1 Tax=Sulfuriflexus sp. TaxID=2015443 RepID=UPI0028CC3923|nr:L-aspartate oxidase [Sulfuriflexus sp.]MDT8405385.1 L-aspartate oxidase [Sulfuriflexus sp.]
MSTQYTHDVLVIGGGIAGLTLALRLAEDVKVAIIAKGSLTESSSLYAQGGIAAVLEQDDSIEAHIEDTLNAGGQLCDPAVVRQVVERSAANIQWLIDQGVLFTREPSEDGSGGYHLTREGGHSRRRIIHAADATGRAVETTLGERVHAHRNITLYEQHIAVDIITSAKLGLPGNRALGAYVLDRDSGHVETFSARTVVLATGGANKVYLYTTNPDVSTGDGIAMGWRAGCRVANMEFIQFHPTCLYHPKAKTLLLTEAIRGEGGKLRLPDGSTFMEQFDPRAELAPRDIVARAIDHEMKCLGIDHVCLDISHKPAEFIRGHFPNIYASCLEYGYDMTLEPVPVVPAAHYTCGGIMTDNHGRTDINGLYAIGETAYTGLHGANRLASNSLLECLVFAEAASKNIEQALPRWSLSTQLPPWDESRVTDSDEEVVVSHNWDELRRFMWDYVGIVRTNKRLQRAKRRVDLLNSEIEDYYGNFRVTNDLLELRNLTQVADMIIQSAMLRKESRGLHYTLDYPQTDSRAAHSTILVPENYQRTTRQTA